MMLYLSKRAFIWMPVLLILFTCTHRLAAAPTGPTLRFDYGSGQPLMNPAAMFMYFVPLISPEPIMVNTNSAGTNCARVISSTTRITGGTFLTTCHFIFLGKGSLRNVLDHTNLVNRHEKELKSGGSLKRQLGAIDVAGHGSGRVEVAGTITNGTRMVNEVRLFFNNEGGASPVSICLQDICYHDGAVHLENDTIAQVSSLVFRRTTGQPQMQITVASVKAKTASDSMWQNFMGEMKGIIANELLPPIGVDPTGHQAMLDFGLALAEHQPSFTFPYAQRLEH